MELKLNNLVVEVEQLIVVQFVETVEVVGTVKVVLKIAVVVTTATSVTSAITAGEVQKQWRIVSQVLKWWSVVLIFLELRQLWAQLLIAEVIAILQVKQFFVGFLSQPY